MTEKKRVFVPGFKQRVTRIIRPEGFSFWQLAREQLSSVERVWGRLHQKRSGQDVKTGTRLTDSVDTRVLTLAREYIVKKDWPNALEWIEKVLSRQPENYRFHAHKGEALLGLGRLDEARLIYNRLEQTVGQEWWVLQGMAMLARLSQDYDSSLHYSRILLERFPERDFEMLALIRECNAIKDWHKALECIERGLEVKPDHYRFLAHKGQVLLNLGSLDEARLVYNRLEQMGDHEWWVLQGFVSLARMTDDYDSWLQYSRTLMMRFPERDAAALSLTQKLIRIKEWTKALEIIESALEAQPDHYRFLAHKGEVLIALGRLDEAMPIFTRLEKEVDHESWGLEGLAKLARLTFDYDTCLHYSRRIIERFPELQAGYIEAELAYIELGLFDKATEMFLTRPVRNFDRNIEKPALPVDFPRELVLPPRVGQGNDYSFIEDKLRGFINSGEPYRLKVSVILPVYNRKLMLARTLAALTHQTYPRELIEVVVADDGSSDGIETVIAKYETLLNLKYVFQEDEGYRLSAVRNLGIAAASHDHFIVLDCDVMPVPELVESYMRYFHVSSQAMLIGYRRFVHAEHLADDAILQDINTILDISDIKPQPGAYRNASNRSPNNPDWRLAYFVRTNFIKNERWPFRFFVGCNFAVTREAVNRAGGFDEEFKAWGDEDIEMGYRLFNEGYYFIPVMEAVGLHQEPPDGINDTDRDAGHVITRPLFVEKCPVSLFRKHEQNRVYQVPKVSIYIPAYNAARFIKQAVDSALEQTWTDLEVCICDDGSTDETLQVLDENYRGNPRVRWVSQANGGIGKASNAAVRMCRGMYIGQLDSDDMLLPDAVMQAVEYLDHHDAGCVYGSTQIVNADGMPIRVNTFRPFSREALLLSMFAGHFRMFRKRDWMRTEGFSEDIENAVDYDMFLKLADVCDFHQIIEPAYNYRFHGKNTSIVNRSAQVRNASIVINRALARLGLDEWEAQPGNTPGLHSVKLRKRNGVASSGPSVAEDKIGDHLLKL